jgi:hypothetical protein
MNDMSFLVRRNSRTNIYGRGARPLDPDRWITLTIDPAYAETFAGQVALMTASNLIGRMTPSLAIHAPANLPVCDPLPWAGRSLNDVLFEQLFAATPAEEGGRFEARAPAAGDFVISFGPASIAGAAIVHGSGWDSYFGPGASPIRSIDAANPCGPAFNWPRCHLPQAPQLLALLRLPLYQAPSDLHRTRSYQPLPAADS